MPNKKGGKKYKKKKAQGQSTRQLILKEEDGEEYGQIIKVKGSGRFDVMCCDGTTRIGIIRGNLRKRLWINNLDMVLVSLWEFEDEKCSIIHKYDENDIYKLKEMKQLPKNFQMKQEEGFDVEEETYNTSMPLSSSESDSESSDEDINLDEI